MGDELIILRCATLLLLHLQTHTGRSRWEEQVGGARKHLDNNHDPLLTEQKGCLLPTIRWIWIEPWTCDWTYILYSRVLVTQVVFYPVTETFLNIIQAVMKLLSSTKLWKQFSAIVWRVTPVMMFTFWSRTTVLYETTPTFKLGLLVWSQLHACKVVKWKQQQPAPSCLVNIKAYFLGDSFVDLLFLWCLSCGAASTALATGHRFNFN